MCCNHSNLKIFMKLEDSEEASKIFENFVKKENIFYKIVKIIKLKIFTNDING